MTVATKLSRRQRVRTAQRAQVLRDRLGFRLAAALRGFFKDQARRVSGRMRQGVTAEELLPQSEDDRLLRLMLPLLREMMGQSAGFADVMLEQARKQLDPRLEALLEQAGRRIVQINIFTRARIADLLTEAALEGYSLFQTVEGVAGDAFLGLRSIVEETYRNRAETIARTEMADASQLAAHSRYGDAGVREVDIIDGSGCGWTSHDDPDLANGSRRTLADADDYPTSHPNCRRVSLPVVE